jgi:obg-like ATPase 1
MADVIKYADLEAYGSESAVKAAGKLTQKGRDYEIQDGDIVHFKFNVTSQAARKG